MSICILTDNTALFPSAAVSGNGHLRIFSLPCINGNFQLPGAEDFKHLYAELEQTFDTLLVLTVSEQILPVASLARQAADQHGGPAKISVLDSQQTGPGLGLLAQLGAKVIATGASLAEVEASIRSAIPHMYTLICPEFNPGGEIGEPGDFSIFSIEEGVLNLYKKVRTRRHLLEALQEFIEEFETPQHIAYFHGHTPSLRTRPLRGAVGGVFPGVPFTEMEINPTLASLFGSQTMGLTLMESPNENRTRD